MVKFKQTIKKFVCILNFLKNSYFKIIKLNCNIVKITDITLEVKKFKKVANSCKIRKSCKCIKGLQFRKKLQKSCTHSATTSANFPTIPRIYSIRLQNNSTKKIAKSCKNLP